MKTFLPYKNGYFLNNFDRRCRWICRWEEMNKKMLKFNSIIHSASSIPFSRNYTVRGMGTSFGLNGFGDHLSR